MDCAGCRVRVDEADDLVDWLAPQDLSLLFGLAGLGSERLGNCLDPCELRVYLARFRFVSPVAMLFFGILLEGGSALIVQVL